MSAILPIVGGVILGWLLQPKVAIILQVVLVIISGVLLLVTAPSYGGEPIDSIPIVVAMALVSAGTLLLGLWLGRRRRARRAQPTD